MKLLTTLYWPDIILNNDANLTETFDGVSLIYNVTNSTSGFLIDLLQVLSIVCNFKYALYMRKDRQSGDIRIRNETVMSSGFYENLLQTNLYEGIWYLKTMRQRRMEKVKFLFPFRALTESLIIDNEAQDSHYDWTLFLSLFSPSLWFSIALISVLPSVILAFNDSLSKGQSFILGLFQRFTASLATTFGGIFQSRNDPHRSTLFVQYFCFGIVVWITYRASLTSQLSVNIKHAPFEAPEEVLDTNFLLLTARQENSLGHFFLNAEPRSVEHDLLRSNMDLKYSFVGSDRALHTLKNSRKPMAVYHYEEEILFKSRIQNICGLRTVWKSKSPMPTSVAFRKDFEHIEKIDNALRYLIESGIFARLLSKYSPSKSFEKCPSQIEGLELGYDKLFSIFLFLIALSIAALLCLFIEVIVKCIK